MSDDRAKMLEGLAQDFQRLREGISALGAKADELDRLGDWLQQNLDEVPAIGPGPAAAAMAVIRKLKGRVAELEAELAETLEDAVRQGAYCDKDGTYHSNGISTWLDMMNRLVELGRFEITWDSGEKDVEGRFLPRKESNGQAT